MNKKLRLCLVPVLILMLLMSVFPVFAETDGNYTYTVYSYKNPDSTYTKYAHITKYTGSESNVTIPSSLGGYPVWSLGSSVFANNTNLKSVVVPGCIQEIGSYVFSNCTNLSDVTLSNGLLSIGGSAFEKCTSLKSITIPSSVTSMNGWVFYNCENLVNISLPSTLTKLGDNILYKTPYYNNEANWSNNLLYFNNYLLDSKNNIEGAVNIKAGTTLISSYALSSTKITSVTIPESVKYICSQAFSWNPNLTSVKLPSNLSFLGNNAFSRCEALTTVTIPQSITRINDSAFSYCTNLTQVTLPANLTEIGACAFMNCEKLAAITLPASLTTIESSAFDGCALSSVTIPANVKSIYTAVFADCRNLSKITVDSKNQTFYTESNVLYKNDGSLLCYPSAKSDSTYYLPSDITNIKSESFRGNQYLKDIYLHEKISSVSSLTFLDAFALENIYFTGNHKTLKSVNGVLLEGSALRIYPQGRKASDYTVPGEATEIRSSAFHKNPYLTSITFPESVTKISSSSIEYCDNLKSIKIPKSATDINSSFVYSCPELSSVTYNNTVKMWESYRIGFDSKSRDGLYIYCTDGTLEALPPQATYATGDTTLDGSVNIKDATAIQKYTALLIELNDTALSVSDMNSDSDINIKDATAIQKKIAGLPY